MNTFAITGWRRSKDNDSPASNVAMHVAMHAMWSSARANSDVSVLLQARPVPDFGIATKRCAALPREHDLGDGLPVRFAGRGERGSVNRLFLPRERSRRRATSRSLQKSSCTERVILSPRSVAVHCSSFQQTDGMAGRDRHPRKPEPAALRRERDPGPRSK